MPTVRLLIKGRVQGVFYRATARDVARKEGLKGWVRNTEEGHVEAIASGTQEQIDRFVAWCRRGPAQAVVTDIEIENLPEQTFGSFQISR